MGNLASAFARHLKPVTVEVSNESAVDGQDIITYDPPLDRIMAPLSFTAKILKLEESGGYTIQDFRFFIEGDPEFKEKDIINFNTGRYVVMESRPRPEGNFTIYMSKTDQAAAGP